MMLRSTISLLTLAIMLVLVVSPTFALGSSPSLSESIWLSDDLLLPSDITTSSPPSRMTTQKDPRPAYYETSEYMIGSVAVGIIFLESNGTIDLNQETWTSDREARVVNKISQALSWWEDQYPYPVAKLSFVTEIHYRVPTAYEPISRPKDDRALWIKDAMEYLGYHGEDYWLQVRDYINDLRKRKDADWAFAIFVVDSFVDSDGCFTDGWGTFTFFGGPFLILTYDAGRRGGMWGIDKMDRVVAHEIGHIFYATDEYNGETEYSGYLYASDTEGSGTLMDKATWSLSEGTQLQIGWRDTDSDGIPDILDTVPQVVLTSMPPNLTDDEELTYEGYLVENPYPCQWPMGHRSVTINKIVNASLVIHHQLGVSLGFIQSKDGAFDESLEDFIAQITPIGAGNNLVEMSVKNSVGNAVKATDSVVATYVVIDTAASVSADRVDVGSVQTVGFHASWAHDGTSVRKGEAYIEGAKVYIRPDGWFATNVSSNSIGIETYEVTGIVVKVETDRPDTITKYTQIVAPPAIVWDRVKIVLSATDSRLNVRSTADIKWTAKYEYDNAPFEGSVSLNDVPTKDMVGRYTYRVVTISDPKYGLTAFMSNEVDIIFDRVYIELYCPTTRLEVGREPSISCRGHYEYDGTSFSGRIFLNDSTPRYQIGKYSYIVTAISDPKYNLTAFRSSSLEIIFDRLASELNIQTMSPGAVIIELELRFEFDNSPIEDAVITANDNTLEYVGKGVYRITIPTWMPFFSLSGSIERAGFTPIPLSASGVAIGNLIVQIFIIVSAATIVILIRRRRRYSHKELSF